MNRFDRILWRINGILLFVLFLFVGFQIWMVTRTFMRSPFRPAKPTSPSAPRVTEEKLSLHLGDVTGIKGTPFLRIALQSEGENLGSFSSSRGVGRRVWNYRYLNATDMSSWWLFQRPDQLITNVHDVRSDSGGNDRPVVATLFEVAVADTDDDHRLTNNDREAVYFSTADGRKPTQIIAPTDGIVAVERGGPGQVLVIYQRDDHLFAGSFSVQDGSRIAESQLDAENKP